MASPQRSFHLLPNCLRREFQAISALCTTNAAIGADDRDNNAVPATEAVNSVRETALRPPSRARFVNARMLPQKTPNKIGCSNGPWTLRHPQRISDPPKGKVGATESKASSIGLLPVSASKTANGKRKITIA